MKALLSPRFLNYSWQLAVILNCIFFYFDNDLISELDLMMVVFYYCYCAIAILMGRLESQALTRKIKLTDNAVNIKLGCVGSIV